MGLYEIYGPTKLEGMRFYEIGENTKWTLKCSLSKKAYYRVINFLQFEVATRQEIVDFIFDICTKQIARDNLYRLNLPTVNKMIKDHKKRIVPTIPDYDDESEDF